MKPLIKFNAVLPEMLGKIIGENWQGVTVPPIGIFFKQGKDKVSTKLFKHELAHWRQGIMMGSAFYPILLFSYKFAGYDNSALEKAAKAAEKLPLTPEEQAWWDAAK